MTLRWHEHILSSDQQAYTTRLQLITTCKTCFFFAQVWLV